MANKGVDFEEKLIKEAMEYAEKHEPSIEEIKFRK